MCVLEGLYYVYQACRLELVYNLLKVVVPTPPVVYLRQGVLEQRERGIPFVYLYLLPFFVLGRLVLVYPAYQLLYLARPVYNKGFQSWDHVLVARGLLRVDILKDRNVEDRVATLEVRHFSY